MSRVFFDQQIYGSSTLVKEFLRYGRSTPWNCKKVGRTKGNLNYTSGVDGVYKTLGIDKEKSLLLGFCTCPIFIVLSISWEFLALVKNLWIYGQNTQIVKYIVGGIQKPL